MNDAQQAALRLAIRDAMVEVYAGHVKLLREMAATETMAGARWRLLRTS